MVQLQSKEKFLQTGARPNIESRFKLEKIQPEPKCPCRTGSSCAPPPTPAPPPQVPASTHNLLYSKEKIEKLYWREKKELRWPREYIPPKFHIFKREYDDELYGEVICSLAKQSDELYQAEQLWKCAGENKAKAQAGSTRLGRIPSVENGNSLEKKAEQAQSWGEEKEFWLSYLPRQHRIWNYQNGQGGQWKGGRLADDLECLEAMGLDSVTNKRISNEERYDRYKKQMIWEDSLISKVDKKLDAEQSSKWNEKPEVKMRLKDSIKEKNDVKRIKERYKGFSNAVIKNLKDIEDGTNRMGMGDVIRWNRRPQLSELERMSKGYKALKELYDLNTELVESLAKQHKAGPPGKRWMGMSRNEVQEVLKLLEKSKTDPSFIPFSTSSIGGREGAGGTLRSRNLFYLNNHRDNRSRDQRMDGSTSKMMMNEGDEKKVVGGGKPPKCPGSKGSLGVVRKLKPAQMMPLHIPGPDSLHQNVCIRAYTVEMDGRNEDTSFEKDNGIRLRPKSAPGWILSNEILGDELDGGGFSGFCLMKNSNGEIPIQQRSQSTLTTLNKSRQKEEEEEEEEEKDKAVKGTGSRGSLIRSKGDEIKEKSFEGDEDEEEGITIESFIPFFSVTR